MSMDNPGLRATDTLSTLNATAPSPPAGHPIPLPISRLRRGLVARLAGPGGYYNAGNAIGLVGGLTLAVWNASGVGAGGAGTAAAAYLAGSGSAIALTTATLVFFCSGEFYHRAWFGPHRPDERLNRLGDLLSAIGAVALGLALALLALPLLAATAGALHAFGKLGSALHRPGAPALAGWPETWPDPFRSMVLLSRGPALLMATLALWEGLFGADHGAVMAALLGPGVLLVCNLLWAKADLLLFRPALAI